jgi:methionyl aminopeptidase
MNSSDGIRIYSKDEISGIRESGRLARDVLVFIEPYVLAGTTTEELNRLCHDYMIDHGAIPATLNYNGFPKSICTSVNNVVCHGIPCDYKLKNGDIINIDVTPILNGWYGDTSKTFMVGECSNLAKTLVDVAKKSLYVGIEAVKPFGHFGDIGKAIQRFVEGYGFSVVRDYCGHGVGCQFHMNPTILHFDSNEEGEQILPGMCFTIEPMVNVGTHKTKLQKDGWTVLTADKLLSAQFEHTVVVTKNGVEIMTE